MANKDITVSLKKNDKTWEQIYGNAINNRLRKDNNLSDVNDKAESRKNLEIIGDNNTTHYHDSRYMPKIDAETAERKKADDEIKKDLAQEIADRKKDTQKISKAIVDSENRINSNITSTKNELNNNMNTVQNNLTSKMDDLKIEVKKNDIATRTITTAGGGNLSSKLNTSNKIVVSNYGCYSIVATDSITTKDNITSGTYTIEELLNKLALASHSHFFNRSQCSSVINDCYSNKCSNSH